MSDPVQDAGRLARAGRLREAEALLSRFLEEKPDDARALHMLASIAEADGDAGRAMAILRRATEAHPRAFVLNAHLSAILRTLGRLDESIAFGQRAAELRPRDPVVWNDLAISHTQRGDYALAETYLKRALELKPDFAEPYNNLGLIAQETGRLDAAVSHFQEFLARDPNAVVGFVNLLDSYTVNDECDPNLQEIERRLAGGLSDGDRMLLLFARAKAKVDLGRNRDALADALRACALKRRTVRYDEAAALKTFEELQNVFSTAFIGRMGKPGPRKVKPIFIVSMPRAGSTLVEQILSSHPSVFGAGELTTLSDAFAASAGTAPLPEFMRTAGASDLERIGQLYLNEIDRRAPEAAFVTDKMPVNFFFVGLIHLCLPDAKIIHVRRNAVDTCVSCFIRHFAKDLRHTYDLAELGRYYRAYERLMRHWRETLPAGAILDVRYEDLVVNFEPEARRLLDHCGLAWDDSVLSFHLNSRPVATHSLAQVRRPIYATSIGRWRGCDDLLQPLLRELEDAA